MTENISFKDRLFIAFQEWEKTQPKKRSSFSAFARWLSENEKGIKISQQNVDAWMNGVVPKDYKYILILSEKLGDWVFDSLGVPRPNKHLQTINRVFDLLPEDVQRRFAEEAAKYEEKGITNRVSKASEQRKARSHQ